MRLLSRMMLAVGVMAPALHAQGTPGFYVETRVTTVSKGGSGNTTTRTHVERAWASVLCSRFEGERYLNDTASYRLIFGTPPRSLSVLPRDRVVLTFDSTGARIVAREMATRLASPQPPGEPKARGDGGVLLGHGTHKFQYEGTTRSYAGGREIASAPSMTTYWVANDPADPLVAAYRASRVTVLGGSRFGHAGGFVLRSEMRSQWLRDVTQVTTREVLVWRREVVPASRCAIPDGYRTVSASAEVRALEATTAELRRLSRSTNPGDRARAKALGDSLRKELERMAPPPLSLREDPRAVMIDGKATKKP
ncbi:MAG: hypothetical protein ACYC5V_05515 [Gemmatimonadaceae bacterium]